MKRARKQVRFACGRFVGAVAAAACLAIACGGAQKTGSGGSDESVEGDEGSGEEAAGGGYVTPEKLDEIQRTFNMKRPAVSRCYSTAVEEERLDRQAKGRITLSMTITPAGRPQNVRISETTLKSKVVEECVVETVSGWELPQPEAATEFSFSYDFEPE